MDNLLKQMRLKYPVAEQGNKQEQGNYRRERNLPPKKSQSFKEKKTRGSWLGRQFSGLMSRGNEFSDGGIEHVTAVAAAVFAVHSVEESEIAKRKKNAEPPETPSFPESVTYTRDDTHFRGPRPFPRPLSDKDFLRDPIPEEGSDGKVAVTSEQQQKQKHPTDPSPSFKKTPTFSGDKPDISGGRRSEPESPVTVLPRPPTPPISRKPSTGPTKTNDIKKPGPIQTRPSDPRESKADVWEKDEMAKIKHKYEKVNETISYWESKKRDKALRKLEESQAVGVKRRKRERGRKKFEEDMEFIKEIAGEARAKADEKRMNDILKAKQKADILRETGDLPVTCFCC